MRRIPALIDEILTQHHDRLRRELPIFDVALADADPALRAPWQALSALLVSHLMKEETILFPNLRALADDRPLDGCGVAGPIAQMHHEHREIKMLEAQIRAAAPHAGPLAPQLLALMDDLEVHARREDHQLFAIALAAVGAYLPPEEEDDGASAPPLPRPHSRPRAAHPPYSPLGRLLRRLGMR